MTKPMLNGDLIDAATSLLIAEDCSLIEGIASMDETTTFTTEINLDEARKAGSAYLVTCFEWAKTAFEEDVAE